MNPRASQKKPYEKPAVVRVHVDPLTDLLSHGAKNEGNQTVCGTDPTHWSPS